jgi:hypothetical protein
MSNDHVPDTHKQQYQEPGQNQAITTPLFRQTAAIGHEIVFIHHVAAKEKD